MKNRVFRSLAVGILLATLSLFSSPAASADVTPAQFNNAASLVTGTGVTSAVPEASTGEAAIQSGPSYRGCGNGGFYGEVRFWYIYNDWVRYVGRVEFKINKGSQVGGNDATISWIDHGGSYYGGTGEGWQDNTWSWLPNTYTDGWTGDYTRWRGEVTVRFIFDQYLGFDPECEVKWIM